MANRFRDALVRSYVGAIALGWVFGQGILHFAYIFTAPVTGWLGRREYHSLSLSKNPVPPFTLQDAVPDLLRSVVLLLIGYLLLRWLYYKPETRETTQAVTEASLE